VLCTALSFAMLLVDACTVTLASADDLLPVSVHRAPGGFTADVTGRFCAHRPPYGAPTRSSLTLFVDNDVLQPFLVFIMRRMAARYIEGESLAPRGSRYSPSH
jgi:hypothetical protein